MNLFSVDAFLKSGLEETGTVQTDSGSSAITGICFDGEDLETFLEMEIESDEQIFFVKKANLPADIKKGNHINLPGRNNDEDFTILRLADEKERSETFTGIYLSND